MVASCCSRFATRLRFVCCTPFGSPVVPEEKGSTAVPCGSVTASCVAGTGSTASLRRGLST
jgi:hypothetical protein